VRELDLVLEAWLENGYPEAPQAQQAAFAELLAMNDPQLFDLLLGRREAPDAAQQAVVDALRKISRAS
jgi:antitoxin CptB